MRLAYIILCFKNFEQTRRLIDRLNDNLSRFVIIVDLNSPADEFAEFQRAMQTYSTVSFTPRQKVQWGTPTLPLAFYLGLRQHLQSEFKFDYVFALSGQDYPLMKPDMIRRRLAESKGKSFILHEAFPVRRWEPIGNGRLYSWNFFHKRNVFQFPKWAPARRAWVRWLYRILNLITPRRGSLPLNLHPYGGSPHWTLTRSAAEYVDEFIQAHPEYDRRFRFTLHSDEMYYQTILANSEFKDKLIDDDLRYLVWPTVDAASPIVLTTSNIEQIKASNAVFARKFDTNVDATVLDLIDQFVYESSASS